MTTLHLKDPRDLVAEHVETLKDYASRVLLRNESLTAAEQADKARRMQEFLSIGGSFKLTQNEMVILLLRELLTPRSRCGCPMCRTRVAHER